MPHSETSELYVSDTTFVDTDIGIYVEPKGSGRARVTIDRVRAENGNYGIWLTGSNTTSTIRAIVRDSVVSGHDSTGLLASDSGDGRVNVMIDRSAFWDNSTGVSAFGANTTIRIGDSTVSGNGAGLLTNASAVIASFGTNKIAGNNVDGDPTGPVAMK